MSSGATITAWNSAWVYCSRPGRPHLIVGNDEGLAGQGHVAHRSLTQLHPGAGGVLLAHVVTGDDLEVLTHSVVDGELAVTDPEQLDRPFEHRLEQIGELELGGEIGHARSERLLLVAAAPLGAQEPGPADGDARLVGGGAEHLEVVGGEGVVPVALHHQHADQLLVDQQRHIHLGTFVPGGEVPGVLGDLGGVMQAPIQQREFAQALAGAHPETGRCTSPIPGWQ